MPYTVEYNQELELVEIVYSGPMSASDLQEATSKTILLGKEMCAKRFLTDASEMELDATILDVYNIPSKQFLEENADRLGWLAIVLPVSKKAREATKFFETASRNRGWNVAVFSERQKAINWLMENTTEDMQDKGES